MSTLYIHIPFCEKKCFYCSFVVSVAQEQRIDSYLECLEMEANQFSSETLASIYIGGGTPTLLNEKQLTKIFSIITKKFQYESNIECTIEANPEGLSTSKLKLLRDLNVNRISLGIQSLNDKYLKYLGRVHDSQTAIQAYNDIRKVGFDNVNVDLMFGFADQTIDELKQDIKQLTDLESEHCSIYGLTVEENSKFFAKQVQLQDDHIQAEQYKTIIDELKKRGLYQYEVSNFAREGKQSHHNLNYWIGGNYIGLGIGAHSHKDGVRSWNISRLTEYIRKIKNGESVIDDSEELNKHQRFMEALIFGLRMNEGINVAQLQKRFDEQIDSDRLKLINDLVSKNYLDRQGEILKVKERGRLILDELCAQLI